ncbi:class I SAM-dependent methyltransferase [Candidatus Latescibacterota bacterium]
MKTDTKEIGLEIGLIIGRELFNTEHLHYGYWTSDLEINLFNLSQAQKNFCDLIISQIPNETKTILDVGCGAGILALNLIESGYRVDCVSPNSVLTEYTRSLLGDKSFIFDCCFEKIETEKRYDLVLFSESFQYINLENALNNSIQLLNYNGYLLICDFFRTNVKGESALGGGHKLDKFYDLISQYPLKPIKDIDITKETAPNLDIVNKLLTNVGLPVWNIVINFLNNNYHFLSKFLQWKYRKKLAKINRKYFSGSRNAKNFALFKTYRLLLYKKVTS